LQGVYKKNGGNKERVFKGGGKRSNFRNIAVYVGIGGPNGVGKEMRVTEKLQRTGKLLTKERSGLL